MPYLLQLKHRMKKTLSVIALCLLVLPTAQANRIISSEKLVPIPDSNNYVDINNIYVHDPEYPRNWGVREVISFEGLGVKFDRVETDQVVNCDSGRVTITSLTYRQKGKILGSQHGRPETVDVLAHADLVPLYNLVCDPRSTRHVGDTVSLRYAEDNKAEGLNALSLQKLEDQEHIIQFNTVRRNQDPLLRNTYQVDCAKQQWKTIHKSSFHRQFGHQETEEFDEAFAPIKSGHKMRAFADFACERQDDIRSLLPSGAPIEALKKMRARAEGKPVLKGVSKVPATPSTSAPASAQTAVRAPQIKPSDLARVSQHTTIQIDQSSIVPLGDEKNSWQFLGVQDDLEEQLIEGVRVEREIITMAVKCDQRESRWIKVDSWGDGKLLLTVQMDRFDFEAVDDIPPELDILEYVCNRKAG